MIVTAPPPTLDDPEHWSTAFRAFLERALCKNVKERSSALQLLATPFIRSAGGAARQATALLPLATRGKAALKARMTPADRSLLRVAVSTASKAMRAPTLSSLATRAPALCSLLSRQALNNTARKIPRSLSNQLDALRSTAESAEVATAEARAGLQLMRLPMAELRSWCEERGIPSTDVLEKSDLVAALLRQQQLDTLSPAASRASLWRWAAGIVPTGGVAAVRKGIRGASNPVVSSPPPSKLQPSLTPVPGISAERTQRGSMPMPSGMRSGRGAEEEIKRAVNAKVLLSSDVTSMSLPQLRALDALLSSRAHVEAAVAFVASESAGLSVPSTRAQADCTEARLHERPLVCPFPEL